MNVMLDFKSRMQFGSVWVGPSRPNIFLVQNRGGGSLKMENFSGGEGGSPTMNLSPLHSTCHSLRR